MSKRVDLSRVFEDQINSRWRQKKFVIPDIQDGTIIEYRYTLETPFLTNLPDWDFQTDIPTIYSKYTVSMIPFYEYAFLVQGVSRFGASILRIGYPKRRWGSTASSYGNNVGGGIEFKDYIHTYVLKDVPAFRDESYITSARDYIIRMDFQLAKVNNTNGTSQEILSTWPQLNEDLIKGDKFGKYMKGCKKYIKTVLGEVDLEGKSQTEQAEELINYVKTKFSWNGNYGKYASQITEGFLHPKIRVIPATSIFSCGTTK